MNASDAYRILSTLPVVCGSRVMGRLVELRRREPAGRRLLIRAVDDVLAGGDLSVYVRHSLHGFRASVIDCGE